MKAMYSFLSRAGRTLSVKPNQFFATSQAENVFKKFVLRSAGVVALLFLFAGNVAGQVFVTLTSGNSWQVPAGVTSITVECWGGGGAGGSVIGAAGSNRGFAGGGAGGAYARLNTLSVTPGNSISYQIGAGGVASSTSGQRGNGGDTWFSSSTTVRAKGGEGAQTITVSSTGYYVAGSGGVGTTTNSIGDQKYAGGHGAAGDTNFQLSGGGGSSAGSNSNGNNASAVTTFNSLGGTAPTNGGAGANGTSAGGATSTGNSANALSYGGAGGGAAATNATGTRTGGSGTGGKIRITYATIYYSKSTGNLNDLGTWGTNTDGTGTAPSNFTGTDRVFNIRNNATPTISAAWTVSGARVNVILGDGTNPCNFTIPSGFAYSGPLDVSANATVTNQNTANPTFGTLNATSTINYNGTGAQTIVAKNYGNLTLSGTRTGTPAITLASGTIDVSGTFAATLTGNVTYTTTGNTVNFSSASSQNIPAINYNNLTNTGNGARVLQSTGTITIGGTYILGSGSYTVTGSTVALTNTTGYALVLPTVGSGYRFNTLTINGTGSVYALPASASTQNLAATLNVTAGTLVLNPSTNSTIINKVAVGTININGGTLNDQSTVTGTSSILEVNTAWNQTSGVVTNTGSGIDKIEFKGGGSTTFTGLTASASFQQFYVQVSNNTTLTLSSALTINNVSGNNLTVDAGSTFNAGTFLVNTSSTGNSYSIAGKFQTAALAGFSGTATSSLVSTNAPTITLVSGSTVEYNSPSGTQTVSGRTDYSNLTLSEAGTKQLEAAATATGIVNLTLNGGSMLIIPNGAKLTISAALVNNDGTVKIESGGSLVQEGATANSGTGTYIAQRYMTGSTGSNGQLNGRFWYMGVPMSGTASASLNAEGVSRLWFYNEPTAGYLEITDNTTELDHSKGYVFRGGADGTYSFSSNNIGNGSTTFSLTRTPDVAKTGFNLLSNPYPSHLSWDALYNSTVPFNATTSPLLPTVWYRTVSGNTMLFDTYNAEIGVGTGNGNGSGTSGNGTQVTGNIAPFQSFWVRVNEGTSLTTMTATNAMRTHGTQSFLTLTPATVRLNISNGTLRDETIVVLKEDLSNLYDYRDSGKEIPSATVHQLYSLEGTNKVAINGIANALAKDSLELGVQIPTAGSYSINCSEFTFSDLVYLEDKLTDAYIQLDNTSSYTFTSVAGTFNNRFVLHFAPYVPALPGQTAATAIAMPTSNWPQCNNVTSEDQWHSFTATSEGISIVVNTATTDIVIELQDGTGNVVAQENAVNGIGNETLNFFGLTAGQIYKVGVRNNISSQPTGSYDICVKSLKRGGCDYGAGPYSLCQYYKATWAGTTGVSYTFTFTGTSGPAAGQTFIRTQNSDICILSTVTPLLPYGSTYDVVISNTYTLTDGAGNTEQITVPSNSGCQVVMIAQPQTTLSASSSCNNGARFRGAVVSSMPWVCGANNWRWRFTEVNPLTMQEVGLPIELNRGSASNYLNLGTVAQLQNGKTYAVQTAPMFSYTGTNYNWGPVQYMCILGAAQGALQGPSEGETQGAEQGSAKDAVQGPSQVDAMVFVTEGNLLNIQLTNSESNTAKRADIFDVTGKLVKSVRLVEGMNKVNLTEASGMYTIRLVHGTQSETHRVIIQK